jgi:hypothetical protein
MWKRSASDGRAPFCSPVLSAISCCRSSDCRYRVCPRVDLDRLENSKARSKLALGCPGAGNPGNTACFSVPADEICFRDGKKLGRSHYAFE